MKIHEILEGWESGPEERGSRERDPDWEYDQARQDKLDRAAEAEPKKITYKLLGRGPNQEPNWDFGMGEFDSQEAAIAARARLMADPTTPNPRDIGIRQIARSVKETAVAEEPASRALCTSGKPDSALGASQLASCKSQGYRSRDGGKSHKIGSERVKVRGKRIKGKKYGGPLPDWS